MNPGFPHLTSLDFDLLSLGHLGEAEQGTLRAHLDACPACREQQKARSALAEEFARTVLPRSLPELRERLSAPTRRRLRWWGLALPAAVGGTLVALFLVQRIHQGGTIDDSALRPAQETGDLGMKGGGGLQTYVRHDGKVRRVAAGTTVVAGDALRFVVETGTHKYLLIASVDGAGHASAYYPFGQWQSLPVAPGRFEVPGSVLLDDAAGPERIFALLSTRPLSGDEVRPLLEDLARRGPQAIRDTAKLALPQVDTSSILLEKQEPPR